MQADKSILSKYEFLHKKHQTQTTEYHSIVSLGSVDKITTTATDALIFFLINKNIKNYILINYKCYNILKVMEI
jgi:hypothetical protein